MEHDKEHVKNMLEGILHYLENLPNDTSKFNWTDMYMYMPHEFDYAQVDTPNLLFSTASTTGELTDNKDVCGLSDSMTYKDLTQISYVHHGFIIVYLIVIIVSTIGNFMVIWTISRNKHMRTVTNYYILNLAICDFIVALIVMPLKLLEYTAPCSWQVFHADILCSICTFFLPVFVFASVLTLVAISIERCYAIVFPLNAISLHSKSRTIRIIITTWIVPCIFCLPYLFCESWSFSIKSEYGSISRQICHDRFDDLDRRLNWAVGTFRKWFFLFLFVTMYLIPLVIILVTCLRIARRLLKPISHDHEDSCYGMKMTKRREESKRRVARMIMTVALSFLVCWTPFYLINVITQFQSVSFLRKGNFATTMLAAHLFGFLNNAINPFIYHMMSERFRKSFRNIFNSVFCCCGGLCWGKEDKHYSWTDDNMDRSHPGVRKRPVNEYRLRNIEGYKLVKLTNNVYGKALKTAALDTRTTRTSSSDENLRPCAIERRQAQIGDANALGFAKHEPNCADVKDLHKVNSKEKQCKQKIRNCKYSCGSICVFECRSDAINSSTQSEENSVYGGKNMKRNVTANSSPQIAKSAKSLNEPQSGEKGGIMCLEVNVKATDNIQRGSSMLANEDKRISRNQDTQRTMDAAQFNNENVNSVSAGSTVAVRTCESTLLKLDEGDNDLCDESIVVLKAAAPEGQQKLMEDVLH